MACAKILVAEAFGEIDADPSLEEFCRPCARLAKMNVLAYTAVDDHKTVKKVLKYGILDYMIKPVNKEALVGKLIKLFEKIN